MPNTFRAIAVTGFAKEQSLTEGISDRPRYADNRMKRDCRGHVLAVEQIGKLK